MTEKNSENDAKTKSGAHESSDGKQGQKKVGAHKQGSDQGEPKAESVKKKSSTPKDSDKKTVKTSEKTASKKPAAKKTASKKESAKPGSSAKVDKKDNYPWLSSYPDDVSWDADVKTSPLYDIFAEAAQKYSDRNFVDFLGKKYTFSEISNYVDHVAKGLQDLGVKKGTRVGLFLPNCPVYIRL